MIGIILPSDPPTTNYKLIVPEGTIGYGFELDGN